MSGEPSPDIIQHRGRSGVQQLFRLAFSLRFFADTNHTGTVDESAEEFAARHNSPGAILIFNCDRDGTGYNHLDFEDDEIRTSSELTDHAKLVVKRNPILPQDISAFLRVSDEDAEAIRLFDDFSDGAAAVLGMVGGNAVTEFEMTEIRDRDYTFAIEALRPVTESGLDRVQINVVLMRAGNVYREDHLVCTIAPWLMLSNLEEVEKAYVSRLSFNGPFVRDLQRILGPKLEVISSNRELEQWMQDIIEIGFSSKPGTQSAPMHQLMNSANKSGRPTRRNLWEAVQSSLIGADFGHIAVTDNGRFDSLDSFGNLEVSPPFEGHPFGRIFYGVRDESISGGHRNGEIDPFVQDLLDANRYQSPAGIPSNWLSVGHVDEFMSFVPVLGARGFQEYTIVSGDTLSGIAGRHGMTWRELWEYDGGTGTANRHRLRSGDPDRIYPGEVIVVPGPPAQPAEPGAFRLLMPDPGLAIRLCRDLQAAGRGSTNICPGKARYQISVNDFLNNRRGLLEVNETLENHTFPALKTIIRREFNLPFVRGDPDPIIGLPVLFQGNVVGSTKVENALAHTADMVNCLVVKPHAIVPKPFGPRDRDGKDVFQEDARQKLEALGLTFHAVDDWEAYHELHGEIHCGTNAKRIPPDDWIWWQHP